MILILMSGLLVGIPVAWSEDEQADSPVVAGSDQEEVEKVDPKVKIPDFTKGEEQSGVKWALGSTGAFGLVSQYQTRQILIKEVAKGSPADGKLLEQDVILGVISPAAGLNTKDGKFSSEVRISLSRAIEEAEKKENGGKLVLNVWRWETKVEKIVYKGKDVKKAASGDPEYPLTRRVVTEPRKGQAIQVTLQLKVMGAYSPASPWACEKTTAVVDEIAKAVHEKGLIRVWKNAREEWVETVGNIDQDLNALGLLATGEEKYLPAVQKYVRKVAKIAESKDILTTGENIWQGSYRNLLLCEYYLATGDKEVLPGIKAESICMAKGVSGAGTWSHGTAEVKENGMYGPPGAYGAMNAAAMVCTLSLVLAQKCELNDPFVDEAVKRALEFARFYVDKGCIPYGDNAPSMYHDNNGRMSMAAVVFDLAGQKKEAEYFTRMTLASYPVRETGHTGHFFSWQWGALGAARGGPEAAQSFIRHTRWFTEMERRFDGSAVYQPQLRKDARKYKGWSTAGCLLLQYCLPRKALYITGKGGSCVTPITGNALKEVEDAATFNPKKLTTKELLAALGNWSMMVRRDAAEELGRRQDDVVKDLIAMLDSPNRYARYGACLGLRSAGRGSEAAVDALVNKLSNDKDINLRFFVINALRPSDDKSGNSLGKATLKAVPDIFKAIANPDLEQDRFDKMGQELAEILFYGGRLNTKGYFPKGQGIEKVDKELLFPALKVLFRNPSSSARVTATAALPYLKEEDIDKLWPEIYFMATNKAICNIMFRGSAGYSLKLMTDRKFEEAIPLLVDNLRPGWGAWARIPGSMATLTNFNSAVKPYLPRIEKYKDYKGCEKHWPNLMKNIDKPIELKSVKPYVDKANAQSNARAQEVKRP
jgi:hypothetical protein